MTIVTATLKQLPGLSKPRRAFVAALIATILAEVRDVLNRAEVRARNKGITDARLEALFARLEARAIPIKNVPEEFHYARDPNDEPYINLALTTRAQYLVTRDNDLLDLMDQSIEASGDFRFKYPFLRILDPLTFLQEIEPPPPAP